MASNDCPGPQRNFTVAVKVSDSFFVETAHLSVSQTCSETESHATIYLIYDGQLFLKFAEDDWSYYFRCVGCQIEGLVKKYDGVCFQLRSRYAGETHSHTTPNVVAMEAGSIFQGFCRHICQKRLPDRPEQE